ncbi:hypothetical protein AB2B38_005630 [Balneola sp. MJW-20]|uniref:hypothetical protein n=1 Tax=Gracilimonas aurantiaca TaxID=3234185 RepID=UPI0034664DF9
MGKKQKKHKLVVMGDSLSQGFNNGGIYRTDLNFPSFIARCFDPDPHFEQPSFIAQAGIPLNLEVLLRGIEQQYGKEIDWTDYLPAANHMFKSLKRIKNHWEGSVRTLSVDRNEPYHNQSIWGFSVSDSWVVNGHDSREYIRNNKERYTVFNMLPEHAMYTTAQMVLNPALGSKREMCTQMDNIQTLNENGGIENLIVCLGHNNIISAVTDLELKWSTEDNMENFPAHRDVTVYRPEHFEKVYREMAEKIKKINPDRVFVPTLVYVTIPPVCRGVNSEISGQHFGYFDYYTRFWIWDDNFDPDKHPYLTKDQAIELDLTVDEYNHIIRKIAKEYGWHVVPLGRNVSAMARRRLGGEIHRSYPDELAAALKRNPGTAHLVNEAGEVKLTTDYIRLNDDGTIRRGGIFSLDGLHPTTIAYGLMANTFVQVMKSAGVRFQKDIDWDLVVSEDTLVNDPPILLRELKHVLSYLGMGHHERFMNIGKSLLTFMMQSFSSSQKEIIE